MSSHRILILFPLLLCACAVTPRGASTETGTATYSLSVQGHERTFRVHLPSPIPAHRRLPVVLIFHGSGDTAERIETLTGFSELADRKGFLAVYPEGIHHEWNDGRWPPRVDDAAFVQALLDWLVKHYPVRSDRIYVTGFSNGGIFAHYLAARLSKRLAAIAPVSGGIAEPIAPQFKPEVPVSVFIIHGTRDPLVPYNGGKVDHGTGGRVVSTDDAVRLWVAHDHCASRPSTGDLPDRDSSDGCRVHWTRWSGGKGHTEVLLYTIEGGGHGWPDGPQFLPAFLIGRVCRDFDATEAIWEFFEQHPKR